MGLEFIEPPERERSGPKTAWKWGAIMDDLRERPNEWARVMKNSKHRGVASQIKSGRYGSAEAGEFDAVSRVAEIGEGFDIYARFVGVKK